jgi:hypothetical protein
MKPHGATTSLLEILTRRFDLLAADATESARLLKAERAVFQHSGEMPSSSSWGRRGHGGHPISHDHLWDGTLCGPPLDASSKLFSTRSCYVTRSSEWSPPLPAISYFHKPVRLHPVRGGSPAT